MTELNTSVLPLTLVFAVIFLVAPVIFLIVFAIRKKQYRRTVLYGVVSFVISQLVLRVPILSVFNGNAAFVEFCQTTAGIILIAGLSAGIFEESSRLIFAKTLLKDSNDFSHSVVFGLGHGLWEVVAIIGMTYMSNVVMLVTLKATPDPMTTLGFDEATYEFIVSQLNTLTLGNMSIALFERICSVLFHTAMTVLVFEGVRTKKYYYYAIAILLHTAFNSTIIFDDFIIIESIIGAFGVGSLAFILIKRKQNAVAKVVATDTKYTYDE